MKRITDLAVGTKVEVESMWHDDRLQGVVAERPEWDKQRSGEFIPVQTEEDGLKLYQPQRIFVEDDAMALLKVLYDSFGEERIATQLGTDTLERFKAVLSL